MKVELFKVANILIGKVNSDTAIWTLYAFRQAKGDVVKARELADKFKVLHGYELVMQHLEKQEGFMVQAGA